MNRDYIRSGKPVLHVSLCFSHFDCEPEQISEALGVNPTKVLRKGQPFPRGSNKQAFNLWDLGSGLTSELNTEVHVRRLLELVPSLESIRKIEPNLKGSISCVVHLSESADPQPILALSASTLNRLAQLGVGFGVDYYLVSDNPKEN